MIQNVCLVTTQSFNEGSLDTRTWKRSLPRVFSVHQDLWNPSIGEKLVAKREFNNPMDKHAVKVVKGYEPVDHLPRKFSRIAWYFLVHSGEINVIGRRQCGRMEAPCQLVFNCSNKVQIKLLKELLLSKTRGQNRPEDSNKRLLYVPVNSKTAHPQRLSCCCCFIQLYRRICLCLKCGAKTS